MCHVLRVSILRRMRHRARTVVQDATSHSVARGFASIVPPTKFQIVHIVLAVPMGKPRRQAIASVFRAILDLLAQMVYAQHVQAGLSPALICLHAHFVLVALSPTAPNVQDVHYRHLLLTLSIAGQQETARGRRMTKQARCRAPCVGLV